MLRGCTVTGFVVSPAMAETRRVEDEDDEEEAEEGEEDAAATALACRAFLLVLAFPFFDLSVAIRLNGMSRVAGSWERQMTWSK